MIRALFPFASTYQRLQLKNRWWHRLAIVAFACLLLLSLLVAIVGVKESVDEYSFSYNSATKLGFHSEYHAWAVGSRFTYGENLNDGFIPMLNKEGKVEQVSNEVADELFNIGWKPDSLTIQVPKIGVVAFTNVTTEEASRKCDELYRAFESDMRRERAKAGGLALFFLLVMVYGAPIVYRTVIYVVFGSDGNKKAAAA